MSIETREVETVLADTSVIEWTEQDRAALNEMFEKDKGEILNNSVMKRIGEMLGDLLPKGAVLGFMRMFSDKSESEIHTMFGWEEDGENEFQDQGEEAEISSNWSPEEYENYLSKYSKMYNIPKNSLIQLINHENRDWNPSIYTSGRTKPVDWQTAFWLWQHIKSTWEDVRFRVLDNNNIDIWEHWVSNPEMQILATAEYLSYLKKLRDCSWEEAMAYYNTWPNIFSTSIETIYDYVEKNPVIANLIPWVEVKNKKIISWKDVITAESYFTAATWYYSDKTYTEAESIRGVFA